MIENKDVLQTQKDNLARLMAGENLTVVHKRIPTAYFDVKNRVLACPIFKEDLSPALYDLFMGHEVGHALNTPYEGLHSALENNRTLKGYLNVIEDVRIEKAIKNKYPGLRPQFFKAYKELVAMDFFGIKKKNVNELGLIDKINIHSKVGSSAGVVFVGEEQGFMDWAERCKTWEEVVECAQAVYDWSKENETRTKDDEAVKPASLPEYDEEDDFDEDDFEDQWSENSYGEEESEEGEESEGSSAGGDSLPDIEDEEEEESGEGGDSEEGGEGDIQPEPAQKKTGGTGAPDYQGAQKWDDEDGARESITEHNAHNNEELFQDDSNKVRVTKSLKEAFSGGKMDIIVPAEQVAADFDKFWEEQSEYYAKDYEKNKTAAEFSVKKILNKNKTLISHMAKEFEMKQNAMRSVKAFQGKTGKLDMNSIAKYQVMDDIFKRVTYIPDGKNHGVVVLLDWSGSIHDSVGNLLEQSLILAEFCKKVNIPFKILMFSDQYRSAGTAPIGGDGVALIELFRNNVKKPTQKKLFTAFGCLYNSYIVSGVSWRKCENILQDWFEDESLDYYSYFNMPIPEQFRLGGTPLNHSLLAMRKFLPEFKSQYQLEKVILTVVTDGFSHESTYLRESYGSSEFQDQIAEGEDDWNVEKEIFIQDPYSNKSYLYKPATKRGNYYDRQDWFKTSALLDWLEKETGVIVTGYFALNAKRDFYGILNACPDLGEWIRNEHGYDDGYRKTWGAIRKDGLVIKTFGYGKLFITASSNLKTVDDELSDDLIGAKKSTLLSNFKKNQSSKVGSRFLTNEFIKEIA